MLGMTERKKKILSAVISDYVRTGEPVGSKTLSNMYGLEYSPATIRSEMADLEEMGYLTHLHTSSGRVPSDLGYRYYVNQMMEWKEPSRVAKHLIDECVYDMDLDFDKMIGRAAEILSEVTKLTSFALTPRKQDDVIKYIHVLPVDEETVILMIVSESGKVNNKTIKMNVEYVPEALEILSKELTYNYKGKTISQAITNNILSVFDEDSILISGFAGELMPSFMRSLKEMLDVNLYVEGLSNIFDIPEYNDLEKAKHFIQTVSKKDEMARKLIKRADGITISIGEENAADGLSDCSMITASYSVDGKLVGKIGVIGPTRMKYSEVASIIGYLTNNLNEAFKIKDERVNE